MSDEMAEVLRRQRRSGGQRGSHGIAAAEVGEGNSPFPMKLVLVKAGHDRRYTVSPE